MEAFMKYLKTPEAKAKDLEAKEKAWTAFFEKYHKRIKASSSLKQLLITIPMPQLKFFSKQGQGMK